MYPGPQVYLAVKGLLAAATSPALLATAAAALVACNLADLSEAKYRKNRINMSSTLYQESN